MSWTLIQADAARLPLADNSIDAIVCDPPYALIQGSRGGSGRSNNPDNPAGRHGSQAGGFMGLAWDAPADSPLGFQQWCEAWAREALRVLRPGGHLVAFGGTRTVHRLTCGLEDAGFEIRDTLKHWRGGDAEEVMPAPAAWVHGQGFP